jgi:hypothetical protein
LLKSSATTRTDVKEAALTEAGLSEPNGRFFRLSPELDSPDAAEDLLRQADEALYARSGRGWKSRAFRSSVPESFP